MHKKYLLFLLIISSLLFPLIVSANSGKLRLVRVKNSKSVYAVFDGKRMIVPKKFIKERGYTTRDIAVISRKDLYKMPRTKFSVSVVVPSEYITLIDLGEYDGSIRSIKQADDYSAIPEALVEKYEIISNDFNTKGQIVGRYDVEGQEEGGTNHAFLWEDGEITDLGSLSGSSLYSSEAIAINNNGQIVGMAQTDDKPVPFLWEDGVTKMLSSDLPYNVGSSVEDINDNGVIVGNTVDYSIMRVPRGRPVMWHNETLNQLPFPSYMLGGFTNAINNRDEIVGAMYVLPPFPYDHLPLEERQLAIMAWGKTAVLWKANEAIDLNLWLKDDQIRLFNAVTINDVGEISALGLPKGTKTPHVYRLLLPQGIHAKSPPLSDPTIEEEE